MIKQLIEALDELYVKQGLTLTEALGIVAARGNSDGHFIASRVLKASDKLARIADFILDSLKRGNLFSNALKECPLVKFDSVFIAFIRIAEHSGNLGETVSFLKSRYERMDNNRKKIIEASIYPVFVIAAAVGAGSGILRYTEARLDGNVIAAFLILLGVCTSVLFFMWRCLKEDRLLDSLYAVDFLVKSGNSVASAVGFAAHVAGVNSEVGMKFAEAKMKLEYGIPLSEALEFKGYAAEILYFAEKGGTTSDVFGKLAQLQERSFLQRRKICLSLAEPVFISLTGIFLLILVINIFMPFMTDMSWL